jgi:hypothetical protein
MLTLSRFRALARSYGSDLGRWPDRSRDAAESLLEASPRARAVLEAERALDEGLSAAGVLETTDEGAALVRLRAGVAARLAQPSLERRPARRRGKTSVAGGSGWQGAGSGAIAWPDLRWVGVAGAASLAIAAGLALGAAYAPAPPFDGVLNTLPTAPFSTVSD